MMNYFPKTSGALAVGLLLLSHGLSAQETSANLERKNLVAWCIVPFDASQRGPAERAEMLKELGIGRCAYDWRQQHVPEFEEEILQYKKHGIEFFAFWGAHDSAFELFQKYDLHPQIWNTVASPGEGTQEEKVEEAASKMEGLAKRTAELGCKLGLYNHGGWGGEPENMVAVCKRLREKGHDHVGIVYNWHHGHGHIEDWSASLELLKPYLHCLNLNGMNDRAEPKILSLAQGKHELDMLKAVVESGYSGPIGILDHQSHLDSKLALQDNLDGLEWLKKELTKSGSGGSKPVPKAKPVVKKASSAPAVKTEPTTVASINEEFGKALSGGLVIEGNDAWREPPITVECRAKLRDAKGYNILIASDTKASGAHWEIFSNNGSGQLTVYIPGAEPDHVRSEKVITDNQWHAVAMQYEANRVRLWVDGKNVADQKIKLKPNLKKVPGGLAFARLVEGRIGMRGAIDDVRIRRGIHEDPGAVSPKPIDPETDRGIGYWNFDDLKKLEPLADSPPPKKSLPFSREPLEPDTNPHWKAEINRDRIYDFYAKQARLYGKIEPGKLPEILPEFPGLDGGTIGHWGNQNDQETWKDGRVRDMKHGSMVSGVFRGAGKTIARAVSVELGDGICAVFDQDTLQFQVAWKGPLVKWSDVRRGFVHGIPMGSDEKVELIHAPKANADARYLGLHRNGDEVVFSYLDGGEITHRKATMVGGKVIEKIVGKPESGKSQWAETITTGLKEESTLPYAIDTLTLPYNNPWNALFFVSGVDFVTENQIAICTIHGDVWICDVSGHDLTWKRFAAGLHQPLGLKVSDGVIHVMCRDQLVALRDGNGNGEADFYECVFNVHKTSVGGHDFITGLERDSEGRWYFASGNQGLCRVSADGETLEILGTGLRNPNGLGVSPDGGVVLSSVQEGNWTPASAVVDASWGGHFGAGGPKAGERGYVPPMLYLPRGVDNSSGGQTYIDSDRWGASAGNWIHFSGGFATHFLLLREVIGEQSQAAAIPLPGEFLSGAHRGRFSPHDGQLYVASAQGWGNYGVADGALQRVRYTGGPFPYPEKYETRENGILLTFAEKQPAKIANPEHWFAQQWNYLYGPGYGSPEYSVKDPDVPGHDRLEIRSVHQLAGNRVFIEIPQIQPVNQLHLHFDGDHRLELFATVHRLGQPFTDFPGYELITKYSSHPASSAGVPGDLSPAALMNACSACHHATQKVVGPPWADIRQRYANNPEGIVKWAMNPQNKNPDLPPMPSFQFLGEEKLGKIAELILSAK